MLHTSRSTQSSQRTAAECFVRDIKADGTQGALRIGLNKAVQLMPVDIGPPLDLCSS